MELTGEDLSAGGHEGGPVECPACVHSTGWIVSVDEEDDRTALRFECGSGHLWHLAFVAEDDSVLSYVVEVES